MACAPFSSPFTVASPFFGALGWETAAGVTVAVVAAVATVAVAAAAADAAAAAAALACCCASFSRKACCLVCTTSGITASIRDRDSMGRPSNTVPSWGKAGDGRQPRSSWHWAVGTAGR